MLDRETVGARRGFLGLRYNLITSEELIAHMASRAEGERFAYLTTPNVDHVVRLHSMDEERVRIAYEDADWCTCDSRILAALAAMRDIHLPVVTGSDLTAALIGTAIRPGDKVALVGGQASTVAALAAMLPGVDLVHHQPPMGLMDNPAAIDAAAAFIAEAKARFTFIAVGSPQQELIAHAVKQRGDATGIGLCIGASIEFVVGEKRRAPRLLQRLKLEWAFRLFSDPVRLWRRYLLTGPRIFLIARADARR